MSTNGLQGALQGLLGDGLGGPTPQQQIQQAVFGAAPIIDPGSSLTFGCDATDRTNAAMFNPAKQKQKALPETALAWLDRRVNEMRVKL